MFHDVAARGGGVVRWQLWKDGGVVKNERVTNDCLHLYVLFVIYYFLSGLLEGDRADCVYPVLGRAVQVKQWDTEFDSPPVCTFKSAERNGAEKHPLIKRTTPVFPSPASSFPTPSTRDIIKPTHSA